tara:strand:+ start:19 stop:180 length:162 start_codon:yes stop_codon:yes gene_type:complete
MFLLLLSIGGFLLGILINRKRRRLDILHRASILSILFFVFGIILIIILGKVGN